MKPGRRTVRIGTMMLIIAGLSFPLAVVMRAFNPPRSKAVVVGPSTYNFPPQLVVAKGERPTINRSWVIRNDGTLPLVLEFAQSTGNTWCDIPWGRDGLPPRPLVIQPGRQGTIVQSWKPFVIPARRLEFIDIKTNDYDNPTLRLTVQGQDVEQ